MSECTVKNKEDFKKAIKNKVTRIRIEGVLAAKTKLVMLIPKASMVVAAGAAGIAIYSLATAHTEIVTAPLTGGASGAVRFGAGAGSVVVLVSLLGPGTAWALIAVGVALGGFSAVKMLRNDYKIESSGPGFLVLVRK